MPLDPEAARFLEQVRRAAPPPIWEQSLAEARAAVLPVPGPPEPVGAVVDEACAGPAGQVPLRLYEPPTPPRGTVLFFHGGGWVTGNLDTHDALCRRICREAQSRVIAVDYRLAPEHPFPAAVEDATAATDFAAERFAPGPLGVLGDSAGGNLAAAVALKTRDRGGPALAAQVLVYPIIDCGCDTPSYVENADGYFLTRDMMRWFWRQYAPEPEQARHPYAAVIRAADHRRLPPALIVTAEFDVLRDEGRAYADKLRASGVPVEQMECPGMIHAFVRRLKDFRRAGEVCGCIGEFLRRRFDEWSALAERPA
jgi:acetyl esterase